MDGCSHCECQPQWVENVQMERDTPMLALLVHGASG